MSQQFPARPAVAPLQSSSAHISSYSSSSSLASPSPQSAAPLSSPTMPSAQQQYSFGSLNPSQQQNSQQQSQQQQQQQQQQAQQQHPMQLQRHPSYEYQPNRQGAGATQNETAAYLNSAALLAEAAKRASIQVVMRDIEEMEL